MGINQSLGKLKELKVVIDENIITYNAYFLDVVKMYQPLINSKIESKIVLLKEYVKDGCLTEGQYDQEIEYLYRWVNELMSVVEHLINGDTSVGHTIDMSSVDTSVDTEEWLQKVKAFVES